MNYQGQSLNASNFSSLSTDRARQTLSFPQSIRAPVAFALVQMVGRKTTCYFNFGSESIYKLGPPPKAVLTPRSRTGLGDTDITNLLGVRTSHPVRNVLQHRHIPIAGTGRASLGDIDAEGRTIMIRLGTGEDESSIGKRSLYGSPIYIRIRSAANSSRVVTTTLFLTNEANDQTPTAHRYVRSFIDDSGWQTQVLSHLFRHTMATLMLEHGAESVHQAMLGTPAHHNESTQVSIRTA